VDNCSPAGELKSNLGLSFFGKEKKKGRATTYLSVESI